MVQPLTTISIAIRSPCLRPVTWNHYLPLSTILGRLCDNVSNNISLVRIFWQRQALITVKTGSRRWWMVCPHHSFFNPFQWWIWTWPVFPHCTFLRFMQSSPKRPLPLVLFFPLLYRYFMSSAKRSKLDSFIIQGDDFDFVYLCPVACWSISIIVFIAFAHCP